MPGSFPFRFCLNTSTIRCGELSLPRKIEIAAGAGWHGIEPWVKEIDEYVGKGGTLDQLASLARRSGISIVNLIGFFEWASPDPEKAKSGFDEARRCFSIASELGCSFVAAPPSGITAMTGLDLLAIARRYGKLIDLGKEYGVIPILEFWGFSKTLGTLGEALMVAAESGRREACVLADVFHMYKGSGHFDGLSIIGPETIGLFHVNDYPSDPPRETITDAARVYPGDGTAPLARVMNYLIDAGYQGMLSLELFNREYWSRPAEEVAAQGLAKLRQSVETIR